MPLYDNQVENIHCISMYRRATLGNLASCCGYIEYLEDYVNVFTN